MFKLDASTPPSNFDGTSYSVELLYDSAHDHNYNYGEPIKVFNGFYFTKGSNSDTPLLEVNMGILEISLRVFNESDIKIISKVAGTLRMITNDTKYDDEVNALLNLIIIRVITGFNNNPKAFITWYKQRIEEASRSGERKLARNFQKLLQI